DGRKRVPQIVDANVVQAIGAGTGQRLHIIGGLLGHTQPQTTKRYAHLADDPLRAAADAIGEAVAAAMDAGNTDAAEVAPTHRRGLRGS
ncbi:MAG: hypothetical protein AAFW98_04100, partial [Pseudomonadota bacterium]